MKKTSFILSACFVLLAAQLVWSQGIQVVLNGAALQFDQPPAMIGGRLMVPLRGIFEALNADVVYDGATRTIKATKASTVVELTLGSREAQINGRPVYLDVPAGTLGGRTMVPLRFVSEALGAEVKWQGATQTVFINDQGGTAGPGQPTEPPPPQAGRPQIDQVIHNATGPLRPGDSLEVIMTGDPGGQASFEIVGVTDTIAMRDAGNGRYEGRYVVPGGIRAKQGVVVGHLIRNGLETIKEATRVISLKPASAAPTAELSPAPGATVQGLRPAVEARFPGGLQGGSVRFFVDGTDFTNQATVSSQDINWSPTYDLAPGQHTVRIVGRDARGQAVDQRWDFVVKAGASSDVAQLFPSRGSTVNEARPSVGVRLSPTYRSSQLRLSIDGRDFSQQAALQGSNFIWAPTYDLSPGTHRVRVDLVDAYGHPDTVEWDFVVQTQPIQSISLQPAVVAPGQNLRVTAQAETGGRAWINVGGRGPIYMTEVSRGTYVADYTAATNDSGQQPVQMTLQLAGQQHTRVADDQVTFSGQANERIQSFSVSPTGTVRSGQTVTFTVQATPQREVRLDAWGARDIRMQESRAGVYTTTMSVPTSVSGNSTVSARLLQGSGVWSSQNLNVSISGSGGTPSGGLTINNLSQGMVLPPVFNVQGSGTPGAQVTVQVDYKKPALGGVFMEDRNFSAYGTANATGHFDVQVDASRIPSGEAMTLTVTTGGAQQSFQLRRQ